MADPQRFRDQGAYLDVLANDPVLVVCPRCQRRAVVSQTEPELRGRWAPRRLTCPSCGFAKDGGGDSYWGACIDPWFRQPLWLTAPFRGEVVWAFNVAHLEILRDFVAAGLREAVRPRTHTTMTEKLPK